jgi:phage terminase large subunit
MAGPPSGEVDAWFPRAFDFLEKPARYKVAYGGRGAAKSWAFARALLIEGTKRPLRILCARETQESIRDSVHKLLSDQIAAMRLEAFYRILVTSIVGQNGTEFMFAGLRSQRVHAIKSAEGCDIVWVEEAQTVSEASWRVLIPTIRKDGSEIWLSFNPDFDTDATYKRFVINPPPDAVVRKVNWNENPYFPEVLRKEMERDLTTDPDVYSHIWEGNCISMLAGAIYAKELRAVDSEGRITRVPYDPSRPVDCYWDLGFHDLTAVWMVQSFPFEYRLIDYIEDSARPLEWYIREMQSRGYIFGVDCLPWDVGLHAHTGLGSGRSIEELMRRAGRKVRIAPKLPTVADGINAARTVFPLCWFDRERCQDGISALRRYRYGEIEKLGTPTRVPLHDMASHGADAFRTFAVAAKPPAPPKPKLTDYRPAPRSPWA